jgi:hypothetical protein
MGLEGRMLDRVEKNLRTTVFSTGGNRAGIPFQFPRQKSGSWRSSPSARKSPCPQKRAISYRLADFLRSRVSAGNGQRFQAPLEHLCTFRKAFRWREK